MKFPTPLSILLLFTTLSCSSSSHLPAPASSPQPNILLILSDDQGYGDCSAYPQHAPDVHTPNLDTIARSGALFTNAYVSAPVCSPSRTGLITGRYQQRWNKEAGWRTDLPQRATTIAEHLHSLGYATMMIGKNDFGVPLTDKSDRRYPMNHGYDHLLGFEGHAHDYAELTQQIEHLAKDPHGPSANVGPLDFDRGQKDFPNGYTTDLFTDAAIDFAKSNAAQHKPFFLALAYNAVHDLVEQSPQKYLDLYHLKPIPPYTPSMGSYLNYYNTYNRLGTVNEADMRKYYLANLACLDDNVGRLLASLNQLHIADNTLIVFLSDNGGSPNTGGNSCPLRGSKYTTFEGGIRIPMIIKWPSHIPPAQTLSDPAISLDLLPTFVHAAGGSISPTEQIDGLNLLPLITHPSQQSPSPRTLYWKFLKQYAIRQGDWKLVSAKQSTHPGGEASWTLQGPLSSQPQLFNLKNDPSEQHDLAQSHPDLVQQLTQSNQSWESHHGEWGYGLSGKY